MITNCLLFFLYNVFFNLFINFQFNFNIIQFLFSNFIFIYLVFVFLFYKLTSFLFCLICEIFRYVINLEFMKNLKQKNAIYHVKNLLKGYCTVFQYALKSLEITAIVLSLRILKTARKNSKGLISYKEFNF